MRLEERGHLLDNLGMLGCDVAILHPVLLDIVQVDPTQETPVFPHHTGLTAIFQVLGVEIIEEERPVVLFWRKRFFQVALE